ncbi:unnamed protein product [Zymoseptoria tritici ST99CH_3D7]|uniref:Uncharacterized protein n=1 Tax=Zymoseptoria tritici (strain ST99CH_3D7) TaxID=1276538 RepID=A0A1X7SA37_ZYMT9|nr:unnamed protein product [Zymoseptoria tritici ST99CH_3D7]
MAYLSFSWTQVHPLVAIRNMSQPHAHSSTITEIWTIHECIRSRGAADAPENPASLLHPMESEPAAPPAFLPTYNDPPFAGPPGRVRARAAANREHSRRHFRDVGRL